MVVHYTVTIEKVMERILHIQKIQPLACVAASLQHTMSMYVDIQVEPRSVILIAATIAMEPNI